MNNRSNFDPRFKLRPPAIENDINNVEAMLGHSFPKSYRDFLMLSDGGEGFVGDEGYLSLWTIKTLLEHRRGYGFDKNLPNFIPIGSNGGSEAFVIKYSGNSANFGFIQFADTNEIDFIDLHDDFRGALRIIGAGKAFGANP